MISNAKGRHVSPGVYTEEKDVVLSVKSLGITSLGLVGETLYGPAFENIEISEWNDFVDYFGGTSNELFKGTGLPKYELPYIAKSYLTKSKNLNVVKVLGLSGYHAGTCWVVRANDVGGTKKMPLIIIRSKKEMGDIGSDPCNPNDSFSEIVTGVTISEYKGQVFPSACDGNVSPTLFGNRYKLSIKVDLKRPQYSSETEEYTEYYNVSLNPLDSDYIYKVISSSPQDDKKSSIYIEAVYENVLNETIYYDGVTIIGTVRDRDSLPSTGKNGDGYIIDGNLWVYNNRTWTNVGPYFKYEIDTTGGVDKIEYEGLERVKKEYDDYLARYRCALTPWIVSEATTFETECNDGNSNVTEGKNISVKKLFRFLTISDGDASNFQVKVSIEKIDPIHGTFDVLVRDFNDTDANIVVLEKFSKCTLRKGDTSFIGYKIGTSDGLYGNNSKYITVELASEEDLSGSIPCGFLGYPSPSYNTDSAPSIYYRTTYNPKVKERKQYFGISTVDTDILTFKGRRFYEEDDMTTRYDASGKAILSEDIVYTKGFHMDSIFETYFTGTCGNIYVDGEKTDYEFDCVSSKKVSTEKFAPTLNKDYINNTIYKNDKLRKFTVCFYGGFDGWDINRLSRTNTDDFNVNIYGATSGGYDTISSTDAEILKLPSYVNTSDYYAYLAGYKVFSNPQDVEINVFATPGIDWYNNTLLTKDAIEVIEDPEDGRGGDALYIMNSPYRDNDGYIYPVDEIVSAFDEREIYSSYACTYAPWVLYKDNVRSQYLYLPPTKDVVRNIAETDNTAFPWFAPAGTTRGVVDCEKAAFKTTLEEEDKLYENRINPIKTFGKDGVIVWGNKTTYNMESPLNRINVRRLMIRVKKLITSASKHLIFEQYDDSLEKQFRGLIEPILADVKSNRGIFDYRVITEVTPETRDQHILPAKIMIKPTPTLEYISITFVVYPEQVEFNDEL